MCDLPAMISTVLTVSGSPRLSFVGHSMATTTFLILASSRPELTSRVDLAVLMAPVVEPHNMSNYISFTAPLHDLGKWVMERINMLEILPASILLEKLAWDFIGHHVLNIKLRGAVLAQSRDDLTMLTRICHHARTSKSSWYTILHYAQNITNQTFHAYDWFNSKE